MSFESLDLSEHLITALQDLGYGEAMPIQEKAIPLALEGGDIMAAAQTGSGKTAAFALPMLQRLSLAEGPSKGVSNLVLVPTRELAAQVGEAIEGYGKDLPNPPKVLVLFGGVAIEAQLSAAENEPDVVVASPGRLLDLMERGALEFSGLEMLVLDEADRLLALGFADELKKILELLPAKRQNLLFSATFPETVVTIADELLKDPTKIRVDENPVPVDMIEQRVIEVERDSRTLLLRHLIKENGWDRVLVFVGTKRRASNLTQKLSKNGIQAATLHGDLKQDRRTRALANFKEGKTQALIATDLVARGIDIADLPCVVNFDLPRSPADYVHRIGRTGRIGRAGIAISFISQEDDAHFSLIEKRCGVSLDRERIEGFEPSVWDPESSAPSGPPKKGKRKSKKDKKREAAGKRKAATLIKNPWDAAKSKPLAVDAPEAQAPEEDSAVKAKEEKASEEPETKRDAGEEPVSSIWVQALKKAKIDRSDDG